MNAPKRDAVDYLTGLVMFVLAPALLVGGLVWVVSENTQAAREERHRAEQRMERMADRLLGRLGAVPPGSSEDAYQAVLDTRTRADLLAVAKIFTFASHDGRTELSVVIQDVVDTFVDGRVSYLYRCFDYRLYPPGGGVPTYHEVECPESATRFWKFLD